MIRSLLLKVTQWIPGIYMVLAVIQLFRGDLEGVRWMLLFGLLFIIVNKVTD